MDLAGDGFSRQIIVGLDRPFGPVAATIWRPKKAMVPLSDRGWPLKRLAVDSTVASNSNVMTLYLESGLFFALCTEPCDPARTTRLDSTGFDVYRTFRYRVCKAIGAGHSTKIQHVVRESSCRWSTRWTCAISGRSNAQGIGHRRSADTETRQHRWSQITKSSGAPPALCHLIPMP
jgi:hypothetical protein